MALSPIDIIIILAFLALTLYIGFRFKNKAEGSLADFFLGGRNLPWYIAGLSMVATTFAADTPLAVSEMVAQNGIAKNWLWWSFLSGGMLTTFFFADLWRRANILTELEFLRIRYSGKAGRFLRGFKAVYLGVFMNCMIIGWVNLALGTLLVSFFDISPSNVIWFTAVAMLFAASYSSLSGLLGIAITDSIQFFIALIGTTILAILVLNSPEVGGISGLKSSLSEDYFRFFPAVGKEDAGGSLGNTLTLSLGAFLGYVGIQWWASWYPGAEPGGGGYIAQRMMSTRNEKEAVYSSLFFQVAHYCIRPWPWIIVGLCAITLYSGDGALPGKGMDDRIQDLKKEGVEYQELPAHIPALKEWMKDPEKEKAVRYAYNKRAGYVLAMKDHLPVGLKGLLLVAFLAAYLSTVSTQLNWGASYLMNDLYLPFIARGDPPKKKQVQFSRITTILIMVIALGVTTQLKSISGVWDFILKCGAGLGSVLILRWYWWRINAWSEIIATLAPFVGFLIADLWIEPLTGEAFQAQRGDFLFTVGFTTVCWLIVTFLTPPTDQKVLTSFYERVEPDGAWKPFRKGKRDQSNMLWLGISWIASIVLVYSTLFLIGKVILQFWWDAALWLGTAIVSAIILALVLPKTRIMKRKARKASQED